MLEKRKAPQLFLVILATRIVKENLFAPQAGRYFPRKF
jgi:hypothetical protein